MTGFEAYKLWLALKLHFTTDDYDFFHYEGRTKASVKSFEISKEKFTFYKLSRRYDGNLEQFYIANFVYGNIKWSSDLLKEDAEKNFRNYLKNTQSVINVFETDVRKLMTANSNMDECLKIKNPYPILLEFVYQNEITIETLIILDLVLNFFPYWKKNIDDDIIWPSFLRKCEKYRPWVEKSIDIKKYKKLLKDLMKESS